MTDTLKYFLPFVLLFGQTSCVQAQWESIDLTFFNGAIKRMYSNPYADEMILTGTFYKVNDSIYLDGVMRWTEDTIQNLSGAEVNSQNYHINNVQDFLVYDGRMYLAGGNHQIEDSPPGRLCIWDTSGFWVQPPAFIRSAQSVNIIDSLIYVASSFDGPDDVACFYTYDGSSWDSVSIALATPGDGGFFTAGIISYQDRFFASGSVSTGFGSDIFEWLGGTTFEHAWPGQSGQGFISDMVIYDGELIVSGYFLESFGNPGNCIAAYDGITWRPLYNNNGFENPSDFPKIDDLMIHDGILYAVGYFSHVDGTEANSVAYWDGAEWHGIGVPELIVVNTVEVYNDELYVSGLLDYHPQRKKPLAKFLGTLPSNPNSILEFSVGVDLTVYPNPTSAAIRLDWDSKENDVAVLSIIDVYGQEVMNIEVASRIGKNSKHIDVQKFASGVYSIVLKKEHTASMKFIKM